MVASPLESAISGDEQRLARIGGNDGRERHEEGGPQEGEDGDLSVGHLPSSRRISASTSSARAAPTSVRSIGRRAVSSFGKSATSRVSGSPPERLLGERLHRDPTGVRPEVEREPIGDAIGDRRLVVCGGEEPIVAKHTSLRGGVPVPHGAVARARAVTWTQCANTRRGACTPVTSTRSTSPWKQPLAFLEREVEEKLFAHRAKAIADVEAERGARLIADAVAVLHRLQREEEAPGLHCRLEVRHRELVVDHGRMAAADRGHRRGRCRCPARGRGLRCGASDDLTASTS